MPPLTEAYPTITGGCLCGSVRYAIEFPAGIQWPPDVRTPRPILSQFHHPTIGFDLANIAPLMTCLRRIHANAPNVANRLVA